jgi:hypothetical protein
MAATSSPRTLPKSDNLCKLEEFDTLSKLRQGYKVTDVEKETLHSLASGVEAEAKVVDTEIARLRGLIVELEHSRDSLLKAASRARSLVAPIRKLPPEILGEIFFLTDASTIYFCDDRLPPGPAFGQDMWKVLTTKVCSSWRDIALSTRKIWSCISMTMQHGLPPRALQRLEEVLELSGNVPLDLTVKTSGLFQPSDLEQLTSSAVFPVIQKHSHRWQHLTLEGPVGLIVRFFRIDLSSHSFNSESGTLSPQLPSLCSLELLIEEPQGHPAMMLHISSTSAPNLRNVSVIMNEYDEHGGLSFDLPWRQLNTLRYGVRQLSEFFRALSQSTSLAQVCLHDCLVPCETPQAHLLTPISSHTLTNLRFRVINDATYNMMSICFDKFTLPHLRELHICSEALPAYGAVYDRIPEWHTYTFKAFVNRSGFPITVLTILGVPMRDSTLIDILECLPRLEALVAEEYESEHFLLVEQEQCMLSCLTNDLMERLQVRGQELPGPRIIGNGPVASADAGRCDPSCEPGDSDSIQGTDIFLPYLREIKLKGKGSAGTFSFETFLEMVRTRRAAAMAHPEGGICILKIVELRIRDQPIEQAVQKTVDDLRLCHGDLVLNVARAPRFIPALRRNNYGRRS